MSKSTKWKCDGCDTVRVEHPERRPFDWKEVGITIGGLTGHPCGDADGTWNFDLCPKCQKNFHQLTNPLRWPRSAETGAD